MKGVKKIAKPLAGELFGKFPRWSGKSAQQIKDEMRDGWESNSDSDSNNCFLASMEVLAEDWLSKEDKEAWKDL